MWPGCKRLLGPEQAQVCHWHQAEQQKLCLAWEGRAAPCRACACSLEALLKLLIP